MAGALTVPFLAGALVLGLAGLAKLRSPGAAARAVRAPEPAIRIFAAGELAVAIWALAGGPARAGVVVTVLYGVFAALTLRLARAGESCGCFGAERHPASPLQSALSAALAVTSALAVIAPAHSLGWILGRPAGEVTVLLLGAAGAVYGIVLAYSEVPLLWRSWSPAGRRL